MLPLAEAAVCRLYELHTCWGLQAASLRTHWVCLCTGDQGMPGVGGWPCGGDLRLHSRDRHLAGPAAAGILRDTAPAPSRAYSGHQPACHGGAGCQTRRCGGDQPARHGRARLQIRQRSGKLLGRPAGPPPAAAAALEGADHYLVEGCLAIAHMSA